MYLQINPQIVSTVRGKKRALLILLHLFEISASHTWREIPETEKTNVSKWLWVLLYQENS